MIRDLSRNGSKTIFCVSCACVVGAYVAYRFWKKSQLKTIDEGFVEVLKIDDTNERRILLLGLEGAGKTSLMDQALASNTMQSYVVPPAPTSGFAVYSLRSGSYTYNIWEIGGTDDTRQYWRSFLQDTDLLLFMVDATSDSYKLSLAVSTLKELLGDSRMDNVPILVIANKQDLPNVLRPEEVTEALDLLSISPHKHKVEVIACQTRPLPDFPPGTEKYTWHHPSVASVVKKMFTMANF